jgi:hypothetical protein
MRRLDMAPVYSRHKTASGECAPEKTAAGKEEEGNLTTGACAQIVACTGPGGARRNVAAARDIERRMRLLRLFRAVRDCVASGRQVLACAGNRVAGGERDGKQSKRNGDISTHDGFSF